ncbi:MAG: choice-of-anchor Q domain-containing protein, partial [Holophagae bacterium]
HNHLEGWTSAVNLGVCKSGNVVRGNAIWGNTDEDPEERESEGHAIIMDTCGDDGGALIENNIIWDNEGYCINIYKSDGAIVRNNTCWKNAVGRPDKVEVSLRGDYISFHNNVVVSAAGTRTLRILGSEVDYATITSDHNLHWSLDRDNVITWPPGTWGTVEEFKAQNPYGWGAASTQLDPRLVESGPRFLEPTYGSPVIDTGDNSWSPAEDYLEVPRPLDGDGDGNNTADRGAFEFGRVFEDGFETGLTDKWSDVFE